MDKKKILIVDDEKDALFILEKELASRGYSVISADNGSDALKLAKSQYPDIIILDIWMPEMDGTEVAAKLQEDPKTKNIPVIYLSYLFQKIEGEAQGRVVPGKVLIAKPYDIEELVAQMVKLILSHLSEVQSSN